MREAVHWFDERRGRAREGTGRRDAAFTPHITGEEENIMGFGRGALLWLLGIPLPIIILLALFWR
jgi:hypothetical protein